MPSAGGSESAKAMEEYGSKVSNPPLSNPVNITLREALGGLGSALWLLALHGIR